MFQPPFIDKIQNYINNQRNAQKYPIMYFIHNVSSGIPAIFMVMFLVQYTAVVNCVTIAQQ